MSNLSAVITAYQNLLDAKQRKETLVTKRREQLESVARSGAAKKTVYYLSEKSKNKEKFDRAREAYEAYNKYCDDSMAVNVDEDADRVMVGLKFDVQTLTEATEAAYKNYEEALVKNTKMMKDRIDEERREFNRQFGSSGSSRRHEDIGSFYDQRTPEQKEAEEQERQKLYQENARLNKEAKDKEIERINNMSLEDKKKEEAELKQRYQEIQRQQREQEAQRKAEEIEQKEAYVKSFGDFVVNPVDVEKKKKSAAALEIKRKFESDIKSLLTPEEVVIFDDEYMESSDKRRLYTMPIEEVKIALATLAPDIKLLREFRTNLLNLPTEKDWDNFDYLKKGYQLDVVNKKCCRNDKSKLINRLLKK